MHAWMPSLCFCFSPRSLFASFFACPPSFRRLFLGQSELSWNLLVLHPPFCALYTRRDLSCSLWAGMFGLVLDGRGGNGGRGGGEGPDKGVAGLLGVSKLGIWHGGKSPGGGADQVRRLLGREEDVLWKLKGKPGLQRRRERRDDKMQRMLITMVSPSTVHYIAWHTSSIHLFRDACCQGTLLECQVFWKFRRC